MSDQSDDRPDKQPDGGHGDDRPTDTRPYLFIPYWTTPLSATEPADDGEERPLPPSVISWDCQGIHAGSYSPGQPLDVQVDVGNAGGGNQTALAVVTVWWADPSVGFLNPTLHSVCQVVVPPHGNMVTTPVMTSTIAASAPNHICLLARVWHPQDVPGSVIDPINDRHYAQHNVVKIQASKKGSFRLPFAIANHSREQGAFEVTVRTLGDTALAALGLRLGAVPAAREFSLRLEKSSREKARAPQPLDVSKLDMKAGSRQRLYLVGSQITGLGDNEFAVAEVVMTRRINGVRRTVGSLGIIISGSD